MIFRRSCCGCGTTTAEFMARLMLSSVAGIEVSETDSQARHQGRRLLERAHRVIRTLSSTVRRWGAASPVERESGQATCVHRRAHARHTSSPESSHLAAEAKYAFPHCLESMTDPPATLMVARIRQIYQVALLRFRSSVDVTPRRRLNPENGPKRSIRNRRDRVAR